MLILVTGGAASGKSAHAERILCRHSQPDSRLYVATMQPFGKNAEMRIARHRALRRGKGFDTAERYTDLRTFSRGKAVQRHSARMYVQSAGERDVCARGRRRAGDGAHSARYGRARTAVRCAGHCHKRDFLRWGNLSGGDHAVYGTAGRHQPRPVPAGGCGGGVGLRHSGAV